MRRFGGSGLKLNAVQKGHADSPDYLLDRAVQDFQGVLLSIHAACEPIGADQSIRGAIDMALDRADMLLAEWRDTVRSLRAPKPSEGE